MPLNHYGSDYYGSGYYASPYYGARTAAEAIPGSRGVPVVSVGVRSVALMLARPDGVDVGRVSPVHVRPHEAESVRPLHGAYGRSGRVSLSRPSSRSGRR